MATTKTCPNCGKQILAQTTKHAACGWVMESASMKTGRKPAQSGTNKVTKMEAMRQTVATLGRDASGKEMQVHLKKAFGVTMPINNIYTYKGLVLKEGGKKKGKRRGRKPGPKPVAVSSANGGSISLKEVQAVKAIVDKLGADKVSKLAEVLG